MSNLIKIARSASPDAGVQFRRDAYGTAGIRRFLRDVIALANADIEGPRYIVTGTAFNKQNQKKVYGVSRDDFSGKPSYQALVAEFIEPPIRIRYQAVTLDGKQVGVYEIGDCQDRPYMMRVDQSEMLRRGDAYVRIRNAVVKMGRRQLQDLFEKKFRDSVSADRVEIGFSGEIIHKYLKIPTADLSQLPSVLAGAKLKQLVEIQAMSKNTGSTTVMARLTHARLFGSDSPYENRSSDDLLEEMAQIERKHFNEDNFFLFETNKQILQLVVVNQGDEPLQDTSLSLAMPNHNAFHVGTRMPMVMHNGKLGARGVKEHEGYPVVNMKDDSVLISTNLGDIGAHCPVTVFEIPLRICVGSVLSGRKIGILYTLFARNLRSPAKGTLRLLFQ